MHFYRSRVSVTVVFLLTVSAAQKSAAETMPSARFLLESWKNWSGAMQQIRSYEWHGEVKTTQALHITADGKEVSPPHLQWMTQIDGKRFLYQNQRAGEQTAAYDGQKWYYEIKADKADPQLFTMTKTPVLDGMTIPQLFQDPIAYPLTLTQFSQDPWNSEQDIPLYELYLARLKAIRVLGTEMAQGQLCYHLHLDAASRPDYLRLPCDLWLTARNSDIVPWQMQDALKTSPGDSPLRRTQWQHEGQFYHDHWLPNGYNNRVEIQGDDHKWSVVTEYDVTFPLEKINQPFPLRAFQIAPMANTLQFVDGVMLRRPPAKTLTQNVPTALRGLLALAFLTVLGMFVQSFRRRSPRLLPPADTLKSRL